MFPRRGRPRQLIVLNFFLKLLKKGKGELKLFYFQVFRKRKPEDYIYKFRESVGAFEILIKYHLNEN